MKKVIIIIILIIAVWFILRFVIGGSETEPCNSTRIIVYSPQPNQVITSPLTVTGKARGTWFFEADFPIELIDEQGNLIITAIAKTQDEWMTEDFVVFEAQIEFNVAQETNATLIFKKDNPSGLPEHDDELQIPIYLIPSQEK